MNSLYKLYGLFVGLTITIMITYSTLVYKVFDICQLRITTSEIIFPLYFLILTVLSKAYDYRVTVKSIWIMVFCQSIYVILLHLCSITQTDNYLISPHYYALYHKFWRVMIGTWTSVPVSYFINDLINSTTWSYKIIISIILLPIAIWLVAIVKK